MVTALIVQARPGNQGSRTLTAVHIRTGDSHCRSHPHRRDGTHPSSHGVLSRVVTRLLTHGAACHTPVQVVACSARSLLAQLCVAKVTRLIDWNTTDVLCFKTRHTFERTTTVPSPHCNCVRRRACTGLGHGPRHGVASRSRQPGVVRVSTDAALCHRVGRSGGCDGRCGWARGCTGARLPQ